MLNIKNLSIAYGETQILRDVSMEVPPGKVVCLMGRNGVGKTTLLKGIMGLLSPRSGQITFEGRLLDGERTRRRIWDFGSTMTALSATASLLTRPPVAFLQILKLIPSDISVRPEVRARAGIGYVPQGREIFSHLTVLENLQIGLLANPRRPRKVPDYIYDHFPALKAMLDRMGGLLSGGQQQQLAIARVLVADPRLIILDEPTEGIQPSIITLIGKVIKALKETGKVAILLVEQYLEFALKLADAYYVMEKGAIVLQGESAQKDKEAIKPYLAF